VDIGVLCSAVVHSTWLLPVLAVLIAVDGPLPVLPSETLLLAALAVALAEPDVAALAGLFLGSVAGSVAGDLAVFGLGRSSRRFAWTAEAECRLTRWVRRNVLCRPGVTVVGARFVPAGRLVSTAAAGRYGLPLPVFLPWSVVSSTAWAGYMILLAVLINPLADGRPFAALLGGIAIAVLSAAGFAAVRAVRAVRTRREGPAAPAEPMPELVHGSRPGERR